MGIVLVWMGLRVLEERDNRHVNIRISSYALSKGFDIATPVENLCAKSSPLGEMHVLNASGKQIARLGIESSSSFFGSSVYYIIISGGGYYQFCRDKHSKRTWNCTGEGRSLQISERTSRRFEIAEETQRIAECSKARLINDYAIVVVNETELKLVICIFIALSVSEHQWYESAGF